MGGHAGDAFAEVGRLPTLEQVLALKLVHRAVELFEDRYRELTRSLLAELSGATVAERLDHVARLMSEQGYMADWQESAGAFRLSEHNCAIRAVAERFPEVCAAEERFLREVLGAQVERRSHIPSGCNACEYTITFAPKAPEESE